MLPTMVTHPATCDDAGVRPTVLIVDDHEAFRASARALLQAEGFDVVEVGQGYASLSAPAKHLEADIASGFVHHDGNPVLRWMVGNAVVEMDAAGNIKPDRKRSSEKIDGVAAWCDALFAWAAQPPEEEPFVSVYETRGLLLIGGPG